MQWSCCPSPTWTEPSSAVRRSRPTRSRRFAGRGEYPLVALVVLDGWGLAPPGPGNAVDLADTPVFDGLWERYPHTTLAASGEAVGLPAGQMGNSEVGHLTIGSGRVVDQDLMRVSRAIRSGELSSRTRRSSAAFERARERGRERSPDRPRLLRRRPLAHRSPAGAARACAAQGMAEPHDRARVHRRS